MDDLEVGNITFRQPSSSAGVQICLRDNGTLNMKDVGYIVPTRIGDVLRWLMSVHAENIKKGIA